MTTVALVYDEGPGVGLGHRSRMQTLARALTTRGLEVTLGTEPQPADVLVVDSYLRRADDALTFPARVVVAVEDLERDLAVDLLVDPNPGGRPDAYAKAGVVLRGPRYALVPSAAGPPPPPQDPARLVLVTTGAADTEGAGASIAAGIVAGAPELEVRLVIGAWGSTVVPDGVVPVVGADSLAADLTAADVVVTAAGVTMLESLLLGRPTVAVQLAANQERAVAGAEQAGAVARASLTDAAGVTLALCADSARRLALSAAATSYVDGGGPQRVAEEICALL